MVYVLAIFAVHIKDGQSQSEAIVVAHSVFSHGHGLGPTARYAHYHLEHYAHLPNGGRGITEVFRVHDQHDTFVDRESNKDELIFAPNIYRVAFQEIVLVYLVIALELQDSSRCENLNKLVCELNIYV